MKRLLMLLIFASLAGCGTLHYQESYKQSAPTKYPRTAHVMVFEYRNTNIDDLYHLLYGDYLIIGKSAFTGAYEDPRESVDYAKSIGTDVLVTSAQFKETQASYAPMITPTSSTSYISGNIGTGPFYGTANTYGTTTSMVPVYIDRYVQSALFLKNVHHVTPLWEKKRPDYKETEANDLSGVWYSENFDLMLYQSGKQIVGFFATSPKDKDKGRIDDLKLIFNPETGAGVYLMADRTPQPAQFKVNKFRNLEVSITSLNESFSFARR